MRSRPAAALLALVAGLLVPLVATTTGSATAAGTTARASDPTPKSDTRFTASPLPTWQTNGVVYAVEAVGNVVYVGGNFTKVRPPGAAPGEQEVPRRNLAAFNATTGALLRFWHNFRGPVVKIPDSGVFDAECSRVPSRPAYFTCDTVYEIRASTDRKRIFVGGDFQSVDGRRRGNVAAFNVRTNALTAFRVKNINGRVRALVPSRSRLYIGGEVFRVAGKRRYHLAAVRTTNGALTSWAPRTDGYVIALALTTDRKRVIIGGDFDHVNGQRRRGVRAVSAATGRNTTWLHNLLPGRSSTTRRSYVTDLAVDRDTVYIAVEGLSYRVFDGRLAVNPTNGKVRWRNTCLGATWAIERVGAALYTGSHAHNCRLVAGGFSETSQSLLDRAGDEHYHRLQAEVARTGAPRLLHWTPSTNGGPAGDEGVRPLLGPRDLTYASKPGILWVGGQFTEVNGVPQQGLTRFGGAGSPATETAVPDRPSAPLVVSDDAGSVLVSWEATSDQDNATLTYTLQRNGQVVGSRTATSAHDGPRPTMTFRDTGLTPGATPSYRVVATDPSGARSAPSTAVSVVVASAPDTYRQAVLGDGPRLYWPFDDQADRAAGSLVAAGGGGRYTSTGVTHGVPGVLQGVAGDTAVTLDGTSGLVRGRGRASAPGTFSAELWFKGTGPGKLLGYGSSQTTLSTYADRTLYVDNGGRLVFGMWDSSRGRHTVSSTARVDDGSWHHAVATRGSGGTMRLYLDGAQVASGPLGSTYSYTGSWQVGGDQLTGWPQAPTSPYYAGTVDELAVYPTQLDLTQVQDHFAARSGS